MCTMSIVIAIFLNYTVLLFGATCDCQYYRTQHCMSTMLSLTGATGTVQCLFCVVFWENE